MKLKNLFQSETEKVSKYQREKVLKKKSHNINNPLIRFVISQSKLNHRNIIGANNDVRKRFVSCGMRQKGRETNIIII